MSYANHVCYADQFGMVADYLTGPYLGALNPNFTDNTPAWNAIMANASPGDTIVMPAGYCGFKSKPAPIPDFVKVIGSGSISALVKCYNSIAIEDIFITIGVFYCTVEDLIIMCGDGFINGVGIGRVATSAADAPYRARLSNINVSYLNTGMWYGAVKISGQNGQLNYGTRSHVIHDCVLRASYYGLQLTAANGCKATGLTVVMKDTTGWGVWLIGVPNNPTTDFYCDGTLETSILCYSTLTSMFNCAVVNQVDLDANCIGVTVNAGYLTGTPIVGGRDNRVLGNGQQWNSPT
jgi:hypothetical protein